MVESVIVTPHSWGRTQALKQRPRPAPRREQTAVEIFKSCGPACSHASVPAAPSLHLPAAPPAQHAGFIATQDSGCQDRGARTAKPGAPSKPTPPTRPVCRPRGTLRAAGKVRAAAPGGPAPAPPGRDLAFLRAAPLRSAAARVGHQQPALGSPSTPGNAEPKGQDCPTPRTPGSRKGVSETCSPAEEACVCGATRRGEPAAGSAGEGTRPGCPNFREPSGLAPIPRQSPALLARRGRQGPPRWPGGAGTAVRGVEAAAPPRRILTTRGGRAAQPERQQHPQPSRAQGGHLLDRLLRRRRRHRRGRSTWGGGPDRGAPTFSPPLPASADHSAALHRETPAPLPAPPVRRPRSRAAASAAARSLAATFWAVQRSSLVCPSASAASSHLKPRPLPPAPPPPRHPGVSRRKKRRPSSARRDLLGAPRHAGRPRPAAAPTRAPQPAPWTWGRPPSPASAGG